MLKKMMIGTVVVLGLICTAVQAKDYIVVVDADTSIKWDTRDGPDMGLVAKTKGKMKIFDGNRHILPEDFGPGNVMAMNCRDTYSCVYRVSFDDVDTLEVLIVDMDKTGGKKFLAKAVEMKGMYIPNKAGIYEEDGYRVTLIDDPSVDVQGVD